jgi:G2/M phase-specific E3 ubiquitin-protein ligase
MSTILCLTVFIYSSYCDFHRPFQNIPSKTIKAISETECPICYRKFNREKERIAFDFLVTPCCTKLIHRDCIQRHSLNAGYFFKCPICNNTKEFIKEMQTFGIYIPEQLSFV